jgi:CheY-like chemotaxis protein
VVADVQMPGITGLQLCRRIRESQYSPDVNVIVYTAGMATPEEAKQAGCDEYFLKTDPLPRLRDKVRKYTNARPAPPRL